MLAPIVNYHVSLTIVKYSGALIPMVMSSHHVVAVCGSINRLKGNLANKDSAKSLPTTSVNSYDQIWSSDFKNLKYWNIQSENNNQGFALDESETFYTNQSII